MPGQQRRELRIVAGLAGGQGHGQRGTAGVDEGVDFRRPPATRAAQGVINRLVGQILVIRYRPLCGRRRGNE